MTEVSKFLRPRLVGTRFDGHRVPLEILKDLAVLEQMIVEVAKWQYLLKHPDRKRMPKGFRDGLTLKLAGIEEGSAVLDLVLEVEQPELLLKESQEFFEQARDSILAAIDAADKNQPITELPEHLLDYFNRLGRSLKENEAIEFRPESAKDRAVLNRRTRRRLALASASVQELSEEVGLRGTIPKADQDQMTFELHVLGGPKVLAPLELPHLETVLKAFEGYRSGTKVLLQGVGRYDRQGRLKKIESVEHLNFLEPNDVPARLFELSQLETGWFDGTLGSALSSRDLVRLEMDFEVFYPDHLPLPHIYPTAEGGIQIEWSIKDTEASLEIPHRSRKAEWQACNVKNDRCVERCLDIEQPESWAWIVEQLTQAGANK